MAFFRGARAPSRSASNIHENMGTNPTNMYKSSFEKKTKKNGVV